MMLLTQEQVTTPDSSPFGTLLLVAAVFSVYYFLVIRPQRRKMQTRRSLNSAVTVGDRVRTASGMIGTVVSLTDDTVILDLIAGQVEFDRRAIAHRFGADDET